MTADEVGLVAEVSARIGALAIDATIRTGPGALVLVGPNGAGKSALLSLIVGARRPTRGRVSLGPRVLFDATRGVDVPARERRLGYVPQDSALFPHLDVRGNVAFGVEHGGRARTREERDDAVARALAELRIEPLSKRRPDTLSGGERQRVAIARALAIEPAALLLDEPLSALDVRARAEVRAALIETLSERRIPAVIVTHDAYDVRAFGDAVAVLEAGRTVQTGSWDELSAAPASPFVEALVAGLLG